MKFKPGFFNGWLYSMLVSACITFITVFFLYQSNNIDRTILLSTGSIVFWVSFLLHFIFFGLPVKRAVDSINKIMQSGKKSRDQDYIFLKGGLSEIFNPLSGIDDQIASFSTLKEKEIEELKKSEIFRREFIANISHELKTPLFAAQGFIHTLIDGADNDEKVRMRFLNKAAKSLDGLEILVQDLLMLSQIETGEIKMKIEPQDLFALADEVVEEFEEAAGRKKIKLKIEEPKKKALALADAKWIRQVLTNLISNAIQNTPEKGNITLKFDVSLNSVEITVKDNGSGISEENLPRIFERFYRVDKSRSRDQGGTGLGLAIVKHILEGHHSKAEVKSEVGKGSEFSFKLERVKGEKGEK